jgi:hypothetical protein
MEEHAAERMRDLQVTTIESLRDRVGALSGGQRQAVAVARATLWECRGSSPCAGGTGYASPTACRPRTGTGRR